MKITPRAVLTAKYNKNAVKYFIDGTSLNDYIKAGIIKMIRNYNILSKSQYMDPEQHDYQIFNPNALTPDTPIEIIAKPITLGNGTRVLGAMLAEIDNCKTTK